MKMTAAGAPRLLALGLTALAPLAAQAQEQPWKFEAAIYGWFPAVGGSTSYPAGSGGTTIDVSTENVIDALKFAFMGEFEARKGKWGLWSDLVYADFSDSKSGSRDFTVGHRSVGVDANLNLGVTTWVWTVAGVYNLDTGPAGTVDLLLGTRLLDLQQDLNWSVSNSIPRLPGRSGSSSVDASNWDAIIGVKGRYAFGAERRWFVPYYLDVGTGESKLTWQVNAGIGYRFDWGSLFASWRYLDYEFKSGKPVDDLNLNGPLLGVAFQW